jgi:hypothetical protein
MLNPESVALRQGALPSVRVPSAVTRSLEGRETRRHHESSEPAREPIGPASQSAEARCHPRRGPVPSPPRACAIPAAGQRRKRTNERRGGWCTGVSCSQIEPRSTQTTPSALIQVGDDVSATTSTGAFAGAACSGSGNRIGNQDGPAESPKVAKLMQ